MTFMKALSSSMLLNSYCERRRQCDGTICQKCYAANTEKRYKNLRKCLETNTRLLTEGIIPWDALPYLPNERYFRFEAFGDLINENHFENFCFICDKNPQTTFALWTKNPFIIERVLERREKPENLIIVLSSAYLNTPSPVTYDFVDKYFTVYDKKTIEEENIPINCGGKKCIECLNCYRKDGPTMIYEKLK